MLDTADFAKKVAIKQIKNEIQKTDALVKKTTNNSTLESKIIYILKVKYQRLMMKRRKFTSRVTKIRKCVRSRCITERSYHKSLHTKPKI